MGTIDMTSKRARPARPGDSTREEDANALPDGPPMTWQPGLGDRVRVAASGRLGTVVHITLTEWGFLYDLEHAGAPDAAMRTERRTYATGELAPDDSTPAEPEAG